MTGAAMPMRILRILSCAAVLFGAGAAAPGPQPRSAPPNIVVILADDLGYGDVRAFNPKSRIPTPHLDRLAREGMRFVDAHSNSSVCTPTRYGLLTGRYAWRTDLKAGVLWGEGAPLIEPDRLTLPAMLKRAGYTTAGIGKWHLGVEWAAGPGAARTTRTRNQIGWIDFQKPFAHGPRTRGFDRYFGIVASLDMPPYVYLDDDRLSAQPTTTLPGIREGDPGFYRPGPASADFRPERVQQDLVSKAIEYIDARARDPQPFFLYVALASPHTPVLPSPAYRGRTGIGPYGDFVAEMDAGVGALLEALDRAKVAERTLVLFTSDNGPAPLGGIGEAKSHGHDAAGGWRGTKAGLYEGGHRVPFLVRWPGRVPAGTTSSRPTVMTDVMATLAAVSNASLHGAAAEDSVSFAGNLANPTTDATRARPMVLHSQNGSFAVRDGRWKLMLTHGAGVDGDPPATRPDGTRWPPMQLFDLEADPGEATNLVDKEPAVAARLQQALRAEQERSKRE